jgi:hypothetical protein
MRFLKRQTINRRQLKSTTVYSDITDSNVYINPLNSGSLVLPSGTDAQIPSSPINGMMRYNVDHSEVQVYQGNTWRSLRFKESTGITKDSYSGDGSTTVFGPVNPQPPTTVASGTTWNGDHIVVIVGGVYQINGTNYEILDGSAITIGAGAPGPYTTGQKYIQFTSASPGLATPITLLSGFDQ